LPAPRNGVTMDGMNDRFFPWGAAIGLAAMVLGCGNTSGSNNGDDAGDSGRATSDGGSDSSADAGARSDGSPTGDSSSTDSPPGDAKGGGDSGHGDVQKPGPSKELFEHPYYSCSRNFYVATTGSDTNDGTSVAKAWATIAHADTSARKGGDCINVEAGTYPHFNDNLTYGGSTASKTGYVVYRCTTPAFVSGNGCVITDTGDAVRAGMYTTSTAYPNYLIFDGFNFVTTDDTVSNDVAIGCAGPGTFGMTQTASLGCHHWFILNNVITGHGQAGVNINDTEFLYTVHNEVTQNAHMGCVGYYGSGIAYVVAKPVTGYTKTPDDTNADDDAALNMMGVQGPAFPFNQVVAWNAVGNNYQGCTSLGNTDGNGIIIDTFNITKCNANMVDYPNSTLVAFNVVYNSGGGGVHVFASAHVTVANNSVYYNSSDPTQEAWDRPGIDVNCGSGTGGFGAGTNLFLNNIAYALPNGQACPGSNDTYPGSEIPFSIGGDGTNDDGVYNTPGGNISFSIGTPCHETDSSGNATAAPNPAWSCTSNKCNTDPKWVEVGTSSPGSLMTPPSGANFALKAGSPGIGFGKTEAYLPASSVDVGACGHELTVCP
jgi:hypothetical protein